MCVDILAKKWVYTFSMKGESPLSREQVVTFALEEVDVDRVLVLFGVEVFETFYDE